MKRREHRRKLRAKEDLKKRNVNNAYRRLKKITEEE